ncbi:Trichodiene oxygenase [Daldinia childiae]|uniref:Trichodiene oxygenase n=1 Tax=Daldinia childiae TaxID=326645 RepID=UPI001446D01D|nr:Trichodiene oxygenase [Daldinia childiae]KAF3058041.1 Trichodiene oxygenase [Daldinia childiae]
MGQEGFEIILAGAETTSQTLATAAYNILTNPDSVLSRLQAELNEAMPDPNSRLPLKLLENLPWLTAVIKESLRVQAIITSRLPVISPEKPLHYKDWIFPVGTPVGMSLRDVLLDPDVFDEPDKFLPERWLSSNPNPERLDRYFVPFSRGSRMCLGMNLAMANLYITLAVMFRRHNFKLHDTNWARDIQIVREDFIGEVSKDSKGVRIKYA